MRRLDATQNLWEVSHDFVARQFALLLGRLHPNRWPKLAMFAIPALFILVLLGAVIGGPTYVQYEATAALEDMGVSISGHKYNKLAQFPSDTTDATLRKALTPLIASGVSGISLSQTKVASLPPLPAGLQTLDLSGTEVASLPPLPASLLTLDLSVTKVASLPPLPASLHALNFDGTDVAPNDPALQELRSRRTRVNIGPFP